MMFLDNKGIDADINDKKSEMELAIKINNLPFLYDCDYSFLAYADIEQQYDLVEKIAQAIINNGYCYEDAQYYGIANRDTIWRYQFPLITGRLFTYANQPLIDVYICFDNDRLYRIGYLPDKYTKTGKDLINNKTLIALQICGGEKRFKTGNTYETKNEPYTIKIKYENSFSSSETETKNNSEIAYETMKVVGTRYYKKNVLKLIGELKNNNQLIDNDDYKEERNIFIDYWDGNCVYQYEQIKLECVLKPELNNIYDKNAVAVYVLYKDNLYHIGYIPREHTAIVKERLEQNYNYMILFSGLKYRTVYEDSDGESRTQVCEASTPFMLLWSKTENENRYLL